MAAVKIVRYDTPKNSAIKKAAAPIIGGVMSPPVEAMASTAPEKLDGKPTLFIIGMVSVPVVATFAAAEPEIIPVKPLAKIATLAGPPTRPPEKYIPIFVSALVAPVAESMAPNNTNKPI